jgi:SNF2 family DNA or RNA helicase
MDRTWRELDWNVHLASSSAMQFSTWELHPSETPQVVSASFRNRRPKTKSYFFGDIGISQQTDRAETREANAPSLNLAAAKANAPKKKQAKTRLEPPSDVIKLEDRLFFMLQPPLESLLSGSSMEFPFEPFSFQYAGIGFLFPRYSAILADEMGLGKTMQAITSIRMLLRTGNAKQILLICPKPLVTNWQREFKTWAPEVTLAVIAGNQRQREWHWRLNPAMVKIANYELLTRDDRYVTESRDMFDLVVLDEAQRIKNRTNATSQVVHRIPRKRSWALTGTPIENGIEDLVGICEFVSPGIVQTGMSPREVRGRVKDLILRRTKDLVMKDMPPRLLRDAEIDLSAEQSASYQSAEQKGVICLNEMGDELTIKHVFELVLRLKQICNFDPVTGSSSKLDRLEADMEEVAASGQKAIVFSQWVDTIEEISTRLDHYQPLQYHGRIPSRQRDPILQEFRENPDRHLLLMSYGAGSVGLNLQFCRYVFLYDRWWNPAVEDQAINRAHRIGAAGSVTITRMIMAGTIEQRIHDILEAKRELFREILDVEDCSARRGLTQDEIFGLFNLSTPAGKINPAPETELSASKTGKQFETGAKRPAA